MKKILNQLKQRKIGTVIWICLITLITSCKTVEYVYPDYKLPTEPINYKYDVQEIEQIRSELSAENDILLQTILLHYISNLQEWNVWAKTVKEIINDNNRNSPE